MEIVNKILEWPAIIQGIIGSFLFWAIFAIGQKVIEFSTKKIKEDKNLGSFWGRSARNTFYNDNFEFSNYSFFICIYGSIHYFLKFVIVVFISQILREFIPIFAYVGYAIAFYFIFRSISYVTHFDVFESEDKKREKEVIPEQKKNKSKKEKS
ncbi:MAG: hypothetical protein H7Y10_11885 [Flavobacterium sp.]|nr:hypothetical protein [Flavobacterium sp.]